MGRNPLDDGEGGGGSLRTDGPMRPGDVRTFHARDPKTHEIIKTFTLVRTDRPYAYDLCDAYNAEAPAGFLYYVDHAGQVALTTKNTAPIRSSNWKPAPGEIEAIQSKIARHVASGMTQAEFNQLVDQGRV